MIQLSQSLCEVFHIENTDVFEIGSLTLLAVHHQHLATSVSNSWFTAARHGMWHITEYRRQGVGVPKSHGNIFNEESGFGATCLSDSFSVHEWKVWRCSPYISDCNSDDTSLFQLLITRPTFHNIRWQEEGYPHPDGLTVIPVDINLHWQKDNSNHIHLISLDRFRTCFSLPQKWITEQ